MASSGCCRAAEPPKPPPTEPKPKPPPRAALDWPPALVLSRNTCCKMSTTSVATAYCSGPMKNGFTTAFESPGPTSITVSSMFLMVIKSSVLARTSSELLDCSATMRTRGFRPRAGVRRRLPPPNGPPTAAAAREELGERVLVPLVLLRRRRVEPLVEHAGRLDRVRVLQPEDLVAFALAR